jgi:phosphoserine phosphatase RsbU/P
MMPRRDGYQVLEQLRRTGRLANLPVIMISAQSEIDSVVRCIELGAVDYLPKPFNPVLLKARVGASLEKKRLRDEVRAHLARLEEELDAARQLQLSMVPGVFPAPTAERPVEVFAMMEPAREIGGDLYDFFYTDDGRLCFVIGDVSGKGVPAALFMARTKNLVRIVVDLLKQGGGDPRAADIVRRVNRELCRDNDNLMFVTIFLGVLRPDTGHLQFCNAGHTAPYLVRSNEVVALDGPRGRPLGIRPESSYESGELNLAAGDTLYLFTDGITEADDGRNMLFSEQRLVAALRQAAGASAIEVVTKVENEVRAHTGIAPRSDDMTAMAIRLVPSSA